MMEDMILSVSTLPEPLHRRFHSNRVRVHEKDGVVILTPVLESQDIESDELEGVRQRRLAFLGCMDGEVWMADDFDDPIEEMKEYME